ncbi:MAG: diaminopimelate epimerase, partial [Desulfobacterales bacterium]|nr:diaminopimelate epimerase [Desulfobacterales bacterium]
MQNIPFYKMSGSGNDFILIDNREGILPEDTLT